MDIFMCFCLGLITFSCLAIMVLLWQYIQEVI